MNKPKIPHLASNEHLILLEKRLYKSKSSTHQFKLSLPKNNESKYFYKGLISVLSLKLKILPFVKLSS